MHRIRNSPFRLAAVFAWTMLACLPAHSAVEKNSAAAQAMSWESPVVFTWPPPHRACLQAS